MKQVCQVGVDVDSEKLVCAMQHAGHRMPLATFANTAAGHRKFIRWATKGARGAGVSGGNRDLQLAVRARLARRQERGSDGGLSAPDQGFCPGMHAAGQDRRRGCRWDSGISRTHAVYRMATTNAGVLPSRSGQLFQPFKTPP